MAQHVDNGVAQVMPEGYDPSRRKDFTPNVEASLARLQEAMAREITLYDVVVAIEEEKVILDLDGVRGVIPREEMGDKLPRSLIGFVGKKIAFRVMGVDAKAGVAACSRRAAQADSWETITENQVRTGVVKSMTDYAAFVDIGNGVVGMLPVADISHSYREHPSDVLAVGDVIDVLVTKVDPERGTVRLGLKQLLEDPWEHVAEKYRQASIRLGTVTGVEAFGVFVELEPGLDCLCSLPPRYTPEIGQKVRVRINQINPEKRRIRGRIVGRVREV